MSNVNTDTRSDVYSRLTEMGITLPPLAIPAAAYVPFVRSGNLVFISGHIARRDGKPWVGQLGRDTDTATGKLAARAVAIDLLGTLHAAIGDLNKVERIVKVMCLVNSTPRFHRAASGDERMLRIVGRGVQRTRSACPQRVRCCPDSHGRVR